MKSAQHATPPLTARDADNGPSWLGLANRRFVRRHATLARFFQFGAWSLATLGRKLFGLGGLALVAIVALFIASTRDAEYAVWYFRGGLILIGVVLVALAVAYGQFLAIRHLDRQRTELRATSLRIHRDLASRINKLQNQVERLTTLLEQRETDRRETPVYRRPYPAVTERPVHATRRR